MSHPLPSLDSATIGIIGVGNMGRAILMGMLESRHVEASRVIVLEPRRESYADLGVSAATDVEDLANRADIVLLCVKPTLVAGVLRDVGRGAAVRLVVSIAAGVTVETMRTALGRTDIRVVRAMPNTAAALNASTTAWVAPPGTEPRLRELVTSLLGTFGEVVALDDESKMHAFTAVAGSGPAYVAIFAEALADAAVAEGLPRDAARQIAASMILGAARLLLEPNVIPGAIKDAVSSPAGTTIAAVAVLEEAGFRAATMRAVRAAAARSREMAQTK